MAAINNNKKEKPVDSVHSLFYSEKKAKCQQQMKMLFYQQLEPEQY